MSDLVIGDEGYYNGYKQGKAEGREEVIKEVENIINKYSEYARPVGWSQKTEIIDALILRAELSQLKEKNKW